MKTSLKRHEAILLSGVAKMGYGMWDQPCLLSPDEYAALKKADMLDRLKCAHYLQNRHAEYLKNVKVL